MYLKYIIVGAFHQRNILTITFHCKKNKFVRIRNNVVQYYSGIPNSSLMAQHLDIPLCY
jgi:hypothetical protein